MRKTKFAKVISTIIAVGTMVCATTVSSLALCINDIFGRNNNTCNYNIAQIIQCIRSGKCNIADLFANKSNCTGDNCNQTPIPTETVKPTTPTLPTTKSDVQAVFDLVNKERKANGLGTVVLSDELCKVADVRAKEIVKSFSHTRPNGTSCFTAFKENSVTYRYAGENIAYGQKTATIVMNAWMNSPGHRANILNRNFGKIGIACYNYNGVKYWVQLFTN